MAPLIIVVDDDPDDIDFFSFALKEVNSNCDLKYFQNSYDFISFYRTIYNAPQSIAVILDINMPMLSGVELLNMLNADNLISRHPVVIVTTAHAASHEKQCMKLGAKKYFTKPAAPTEWKNIVGDILKLAC